MLHALEESDLIKSVVLDFDSGGGTVHGCYDLADYIAKYSKPIRATSQGHLCSAAYLLASATNRIDVAADAVVGSIGVIITLFDQGENEELVQYTNSESSNKATVKGTGAQQWQNYADDIGKMFIDRLKMYRGSAETFKGEIFSGKTAIDKKLVDSIIVARGDEMIDKNKPDALTEFAEKNMQTEPSATAQNPNVDVSAGHETLKIAAQAAERERVVVILKAAGVADDVVKAIANGSTAESFALATLNSIRKKEQEAVAQKQAQLENVKLDAGDVNGISAGASDQTQKHYSTADYMDGGL